MVINGESEGVYVNQWHFNNDFLAEWFDGQRGRPLESAGQPDCQAGPG